MTRWNKGFRITLITLLAALVFMLVNFAAVAQETTEISMSVWGMPWEDYLYTDVTIPKFEKENPNIKVKFNRYEDYWTKLVTLYAAGEAPDVMRNDNGYVGLHARKGMMHPLDEFIKGPNGIDMSDFNPVPFQAYDYLGYTVFLPTDIVPLNVLSYNKTLFDQTGISYPSYDWTSDDLEAAAKKLTGGSKYGFLWEEPPLWVLNMIWKMGGTTFDLENPEKLVVNSPAGIRAMELLQKWIFDDKIVPKIGIARAGPTSIQLFASNRLGMFTHGSWLSPAIKRDAPNLEFGTTTFPRLYEDGIPGSVATSCGYFMNKNTQHPEEAWRLLRYLTSTEGIMDYWQTTWVATPVRYSVLNSPEFKTPRGLQNKVPGIKDEEEYAEKLKWHRDMMENKWFDEKPICGPYSYLLYSIMITVAEKLIGTERGDPELVLRDATKEFSSQVEAAKK